MNKAKLFFMACLSLTLVLFTSCSSDDDNDSNQAGLHLEGEWQLLKMDFQGEDAEWNPEVEYTSSNAFGYAPYMFHFGGIKGLIFGSQEVMDTESGNSLGKRFDYVMGLEVPQDPNEAYWYWNYKDDNESFEAIQRNPTWPPHDYSLTDVSDIQESQNGNKIVFTGHLKSRVPGGEMGDLVSVPVEFTIEKGEAVDPVEVFVNGEAFVEPE